MRRNPTSIRRPALNQNGLRVNSSFKDYSFDLYGEHQQRGFSLCFDVDVSMSHINPNNPRWIAHIATQYFNLTDITGADVPTSLTDIEDFFHHKSNSLIIFGVQIGLCMMLSIVLLLLTKSEKRRTAIFALNITGLILETIRFITISVQYNSVLFSIAVQVLGAVALETKDDFVAPVIYSVSTIIWYAVVETSLVLQVRVVFGAERKLQKILTVVLGFLFGVTVGFKIAVQAWNTKAILSRVLGIDDPVFVGINRTAQLLFVLTVGLSSAIFVAKLIYLIRRRQKMGFQTFGPLQVILIMATQCLIVPFVFFIADFFVNIDGFVTIGQTLLTCSLPLSALWASSEAEKHTAIRVSPSFGNNFTGTTASAGTEVQSKKSFFAFWRSERDMGGEAEKGSLETDSDHVIVQRTLHVAHTDSPIPRSSGGRGF